MIANGLVISFDIAEGETLAPLFEAGYSKPTKAVPIATKTYPTSSSVQIQRDGTNKVLVTIFLSPGDSPVSAIDAVYEDFCNAGVVGVPE